MAENEIDIAARRERVFAILADPHQYAEWLVGTDRVRSADPTWPAPGSRLHHSVGVGPATIDDSSEVLECEAPKRLVLRAQLRPVGAFRVELRLRDDGASTHVTMREVAVDGIATIGGPVTDATVTVRNTVSLERLKKLAET